MASQETTKYQVLKEGTEKRLLDIPHHEILQLESMFEHHEYIPFKRIMPKVMDLLKILPKDVEKIFGSYADSEKSMISWNQVLRIMQEEADYKEELRNERLYGHKKIFLRKGKRHNLTKPSLKLFSHQYAINYIHQIHFSKKSLVLVVLNHNTLVVFDENLEEVKHKLTFKRDYASHYEKQLEAKGKIFDEEKSKKNCKKYRISQEKIGFPNNEPSGFSKILGLKSMSKNDKSGA